MFNADNMYIYRVFFELRGRHKFYTLEVGTDSETFGDPFLISASTTLVTKNEITIRGTSQRTILILYGNNSTFALYERLFPLGPSYVSIDSHQLTNTILVTPKYWLI